MEYDHAFLPLGKGMIWDGSVKSWEGGGKKFLKCILEGGGSLEFQDSCREGRLSQKFSHFMWNPESTSS